VKNAKHAVAPDLAYGSPGLIRTGDHSINSRTLYR
jgi:hypothetical protein